MTKTYKPVTQLFYMGVKLGQSQQWKTLGKMHLRTGCLGEYLGLREKVTGGCKSCTGTS